MSFLEIAQKSGRTLAVTAAVVAAVSLTAAPGTAYAEHGHGGDRGGVALRILGGAVAGAVIAGAASPYYGYSNSYYGGGYAPNAYYGGGYAAPYSNSYYGGGYAAPYSNSYYGGGYAAPYSNSYYGGGYAPSYPYGYGN